MRTVDEIKADIAATASGTQHQHDAAWLEWFRAVAQGIEPDRLEEICNAERDGRCVVLPCKAGDTVYMVATQTDNYSGLPYPIVIQATFRLTMLPRLREDIFLTREEAEVALKKRESGE